MQRLAICGLALLLAAGCGGDDDPTDLDDNDNGSMSARVDGANFTAFSVAASHESGILAVSGVQLSPSQGITFGIAANATGTYTIGPTSVVNAIYVQGNQGWSAAGNVGSGSVIVTTLTGSRAAGTFSFTMAANASSGATGTKVITQGAFDVTLER